MSAGAKYRLTLLERWETKLTAPQKAVWTTLMQLLPKDSPLVGFAGSYGLECFLMGHVMRDATVEHLRRFIPHPEKYDRRVAAAGDAA